MNVKTAHKTIGYLATGGTISSTPASAGAGVTPSLTTYTLTPHSEDMVRHAERVRGLPLDELGPCLWRFAHSGMRVRELDAIYRYFHERFIPLPKILASETQDPIIRTMQEMIRAGEHRVGEA